MKIIEDKKNELLNRREVKLLISAEKNPGYEHSAKVVSEHFKAAAENVAVKEVKSKFGRDTFLINANIYENTSDKENMEPKKKVKKEAGK